MKNALENWFEDSRNMLREYNKTVDYCRKLESEISNLKTSTSWKITKPIRTIKNILKRIISRFTS